jgi:hypothetical protein
MTMTVLVPWVLASIVLRRHLRVTVTALVCIAPAVWFWWDVSQMH